MEFVTHLDSKEGALRLFKTMLEGTQEEGEI